MQIPSDIVKRDGSIQGFDITKISRAINLAYDKNDKPLIEGPVIDTSLKSFDGSNVGIEFIQDAVEVSLMHHGYFKTAKSYILYRNHKAELRQLRDKAVDPSGVADYIHASKYAKYVPELGRREVYAETVARVERMHIKRFPLLENDIRDAFKFVYDKRVLPSMRSMQFAGPAIETNHNRIYNCSFTLVDRLDVFSEAIYLLLAGCGVGYSVQFDHVDKLPPVGYIDSKRVVHHIIQDSIEGWAEAVRELVHSFQSGVNVEFSYHMIRPAGKVLKTSGGRAPGHSKLKDTLERIRTVLLGSQGRKLRPIECHKIMCHAADAVLSGGIRRSAMICLFSIDDSDMMNAKTGDWYSSNPWFANSNNSVILKRDDVSYSKFRRIFDMTRQWGEPGFFFTDNYSYGCNPCFHPDTRLWTSEGYTKILDLVGKGELKVVTDKRIGKGDLVVGLNNGVTIRTSSGVELTQFDAPVFNVYTEHGHKVCVTSNHEFPTSGGRKRVDELKIGDTIYLPSGEGLFGKTGNEKEGFLLGWYVGDGTSDDKASYIDVWENNFDLKDYLLGCLNEVIVKEPTYGKRDSYGPVEWMDQTISSDMKFKKVRSGGTRFMRWLERFSENGLITDIKDRVQECVWHGSREFVVGYLRGLFATDGTVLLGGEGKKSTLSLRLAQSNENLLRDVQTLLGMFGVISRIYTRIPAGYRLLPTHRAPGELGEYFCKTSFELVINRPNVIRFMDKIGLIGRKDQILKDRMSIRGTSCQKPERYITRISKIEANGSSDVYCLTQPETNTVIADGIVTAQCGEIGLFPVHVGKDGERTGWAFCNLCEINAAKLTSLEDFEAAAKAATFIGTLQAAYTDFPYLGQVSEEIAKRDALLGIGMTGMMDSPEVACNPEYQRIVSSKVVEWNKEFSKLIGINQAARTTCVKPSGTTSLELGCVASGIHPHHARRYIRRVTADELEPIFQEFKKVNPHMCVRKPDGKWVIEFPVQSSDSATIKEDVSAIEFLKLVKSTQENWVLPGTADNTISPGLNHNVSNTVVVSPEEWNDVADYIWTNRDKFTGIALLPNTGDKDYSFSPMEAIRSSSDEQRWREILLNYKPLDYTSISESEDNTVVSSEPACAGGTCSI